MIRRTLVMILAGAGLGLVLSMWYGPALISWWWNPPGNAGVVQICGDQVSAATKSLVHFQLVIGGVLAVVFAGVGNYVVIRREKKALAMAAGAAMLPATHQVASIDLVPKP